MGKPGGAGHAGSLDACHWDTPILPEDGNGMQIVHSTEKNLPLLAPEKFITVVIFHTFNRCTGNPHQPHLFAEHQQMPRETRRG